MSKRLFAAAFVSLLLISCGGGDRSPDPGNPGAPVPPTVPQASNSPFWAQWGANAAHNGSASATTQSFARKLADIVYDPFVPAAQAEASGNLLSHYQAPLIDGNDFYMEIKTGTYPSCSPAGAWRSGAHCGPNAWDQLTWNVARYFWSGSTATRAWLFVSDWKPTPNGSGLRGWEPVFHPALANGFIYAPGGGGTLLKVSKHSGAQVARIDPFIGVTHVAANTYVTSPVAADGQGNLYYNVMWLSDPTDPWASDVLGAWLVKVTAQDQASIVSYSTLVSGAPAAGSNTCQGRFNNATATLPWPPTSTATPNPTACGSQRPGMNVVPAIAADGTIYTVSRAHFNSVTSYLVAVNPNLTPKWAASMQHILHDGCGVIVPIANNTSTPNSCRPGTTFGVDPTTNDFGSINVTDLGSSSPMVLPDGAVLYGGLTNYNGQRGHTVKFDAAGNFTGSYDFGWDSTPAVYPHGGTYSIVIKDNIYETPLYCSGNPLCTPVAGAFYITQLDPNLNVEWKFQNTTFNPDTGVVGYEWCVNAPAVDSTGIVLATSEDGKLYSIPQGQTGVFTQPRQSLFLLAALGAAYTPVAFGPDGKIYTQNGGHLFIVGN
jgi:hypothetical protein